MHLMPTLPRVYHFWESVWGFQQSSPQADKRLRWGWCNLAELLETIKFAKLPVKSHTSHGLLKEFARERFQSEEQVRRRSNHFHRLSVVVASEGKSRFVDATLRGVYILTNVDPKTMFVPAGWAEMVLRSLYAPSRQDGVVKIIKQRVQHVDAVRMGTAD
jgi:hypothetical protein